MNVILMLHCCDVIEGETSSSTRIHSAHKPLFTLHINRTDKTTRMQLVRPSLHGITTTKYGTRKIPLSSFSTTYRAWGAGAVGHEAPYVHFSKARVRKHVWRENAAGGDGGGVTHLYRVDFHRTHKKKEPHQEVGGPTKRYDTCWLCSNSFEWRYVFLCEADWAVDWTCPAMPAVVVAV